MNLDSAVHSNHWKAQALVVLALLALGAGLTAARLHGFSFSAWHAVIDGSPPGEVLLNEPRGYRSDDWLVALPHCLAQRAVRPAFPVANPLIGDGHYNMLISGPAPARDLTVGFRPQVWGYFISGDIGLAFQWWFGALGLWIAVWLVLLRLTGNDHWTSACGATALLFAPFFQAWSLNCAPSVIFACGTLLALMRLRTAGTSFRIMLTAGGLAWFGTAFLLTFNYTPYLVTLLYFIAFVFAGMALTRLVHGAIPLPRPSFHWLRGTCALAALLLILGLGAYVVIGNWETIQVIQNSEYPGRRMATGGDQTIWHIFRGNVLSFKPPSDWGSLNPCEGAGFFMIFPLVCAAFARDWWRTRRMPAPLFFTLAAYIILLLLWNLAGFPEILARGTLFSRAPPSRTLLGLGIADLFLLAVYAATRRQTDSALRADRITPWIVGALWIGFQVALAVKAARYFPDYPLGTALTGGLFCMALAPLLYLAPRLVLPAMMALSILTTYDINPMARGGTAFIRNNPLSQKILALDHELLKPGRRPVWIVYGSLELPNLLRMLGAKAVNGVHAYPQLELWQKLDPAGQSRTVYNRYAHVIFDLPAADGVQFNLLQPDSFIVFLHPKQPRFAALDVDYILCLDHQTAVLDGIPNLEKIYAYAGKHIYRVGR